MRNRLEDLGRILVLLENALNLDIFDEFECRNKDFVEWVEELTEEKREKILHPIPYQIQEIQEKLYEMREIASGLDRLNNQDSYE